MDEPKPTYDHPARSIATELVVRIMLEMMERSDPALRGEILRQATRPGRRDDRDDAQRGLLPRPGRGGAGGDRRARRVSGAGRAQRSPSAASMCHRYTALIRA